MKRSKLLFTCLALSLGLSAHAATIGGKNIVLVHGFNPGQLLKQTVSDSQAKSDARSYWNSFWRGKTSDAANISWSSKDRVSGGIKDDVVRQLKALGGYCDSGCVFVTHSTGDLVLRYVLANKSRFGLSRVKATAVIDLAGAGGGTELADLAYDVSQGKSWLNAVARSAVKLVTKIDFGKKQNLGVLNDLRPNNARKIATGSSAAPRLRFVGTGSEYAGIPKPFISGKDDSVVPLHSACGARYKSAYDSCSRSIKVNGVLTGVSKAPSSFYHNHYPVLMGEKTNHSQVRDNSRSGNFATVTNNTTKGLKLDFSTQTKRHWWSWGKKVRWVKDGDKKSMSANIYDTLKN